jgi:arylsulfatase A-like enzyme
MLPSDDWSPSHPGMRMVDDWAGTVRSVSPVNPNFMYDSDLSNQKHCGKLPGQSAAIVAERTVRFIDRAVAAADPFLAMLWFHEPHVPLQATKEYKALYDHLPDSEYLAEQKTYWAMLSAVDAAVGKVRENLRDNKVENDTIVMLLSDNGPDRGTGGSTGHLDGQKFQTLEGGIRARYSLSLSLPPPLCSNSMHLGVLLLS